MLSDGVHSPVSEAVSASTGWRRRRLRRCGLSRELIEGSDAVVGFCDHAAGEGSAVAAIEDEELGARTAALHDVIDEAGGDGGGEQARGTGVCGGEVEAAVHIFDAVPGEVEQEQVVGEAVVEEFFDSAGDLVMRAIDEFFDLEVADGGVGEDCAQALRIRYGSA